MSLLSRGTIVNRTYGAHKILYIIAFFFFYQRQYLVLFNLLCPPVIRRMKDQDETLVYADAVGGRERFDANTATAAMYRWEYLYGMDGAACCERQHTHTHTSYHHQNFLLSRENEQFGLRSCSTCVACRAVTGHNMLYILSLWFVVCGEHHTQAFDVDPSCFNKATWGGSAWHVRTDDVSSKDGLMKDYLPDHLPRVQQYQSMPGIYYCTRNSRRKFGVWAFAPVFPLPGSCYAWNDVPINCTTLCHAECLYLHIRWHVFPSRWRTTYLVFFIVSLLRCKQMNSAHSAVWYGLVFARENGAVLLVGVVVWWGGREASSGEKSIVTIVWRSRVPRRCVYLVRRIVTFFSFVRNDPIMRWRVDSSWCLQ